MNGQLFRCNVTIAVAVVLLLALTPEATAQDVTAGSAAVTPRRPDGTPNLTGMWRTGRPDFDRIADRDPGLDIVEAFPSRRCGPGQRQCDEHTNQSNDGEFTGRFDPNRPIYKPEYWDRIQYLDENTNIEDPVLRCQPQGITRTGPPAKIMQTADEVAFFYPASGGAAGGDHYRIVSIDGRKHDPMRVAELSYSGHAVGRWEGDTLVVDAVGFNDLTWLARGGLFHSENLRIVERFRREGNVLYYDINVEDPDVLLEPWVLPTQRLILHTDPNAYISEGTPCRDVDSGHLVTKIRH